MLFNIWGIEIELDYLNEKEKEYILNLSKDLPSIKWVWKEMNRIWDELGLDNKKELDKQKIGEYYNHPVWIMNGIFVEQDEISKNNRINIASYLKKNNIIKIADYGGGAGVLAKKIVELNSDAIVDIIEPYPFNFFKERLKNIPNITFTSKFRDNQYECIILQDILEHLENPIDIVNEVSKFVKNKGLLIFGNCFYPVIKCHLPKTFYLRHLFKFILEDMGLTYIGRIPNVDYAMIFRKDIEYLKIEKFKSKEKFYRIIGNFLNLFISIISRIKRVFL